LDDPQALPLSPTHPEPTWEQPVDAEEIDRIKRMHRPAIIWLGCTVGWLCTCGGAWPCGVVVLAIEARARKARLALMPDLDEISPGEFWQRR
jgi:hypothetical protein